MVEILDFIELSGYRNDAGVRQLEQVMASEEDQNSPAKSHERRVSSIEGSSGGEGSEGHTSGGGENPEPATAAAAATAAAMSLISIMETSPPPPVVGTMAVIGRQREMEDEVSVRPDLCWPEINGYRPVHFFGVFDGHGGGHVSALCKEMMHVILEEELMRAKAAGGGGGVGELWRAVINRTFERMDEMALSLCLCGALPTSTVCRCNPNLSLMGTTAVVALLTKERVFVANCGDSRAVLCRDGKPIPLSVDQKPDREDERVRIEQAKGRIMVGDGPRVEGILAMSRAIGDRLLKQWVISEPEISVTRREPADEYLILGSDGLWDVVSNELACQVVHQCLQEYRFPAAAAGGGGDVDVDVVCQARTACAAALLVRLALGRRSTDNISVVVVDLKN